MEEIKDTQTSRLPLVLLCLEGFNLISGCPTVYLGWTTMTSVRKLFLLLAK